MEERELRQGRMPGTDFAYRDFERFLAVFLCTLFPLYKMEGEDGETFEKCFRILTGFAQRHHVNFPDVVMSLESVEKFKTSAELLGEIYNFHKNFNLALEPETEDWRAKWAFECLIAEFLQRHQVVKAEFSGEGERKTLAGVESMTNDFWNCLPPILNR